MQLILLLVSIILICSPHETKGKYFLIDVESESEIENNLRNFQDDNSTDPEIQMESQLESNGRHFVQYQPRHVHISFGSQFFILYTNS